MRRVYTQTFAMIALGLSVVSLASCGREKQVVWQQKMVIEVETPSGVKSGAAVVGVDVQIGQGMLAENTGGSPVRWDITGEAVTVDVGGGKYLFALLTGPSYYGQPGRNAGFAFSDTNKKMVEEWVDEIADVTKGEAKALSGDGYPLLVTFTDIADPKTVQRVDPDDLDGTFGLCADSSGLQDSNAPWRAAEVSWGVWALEQWHVETDRNVAAATGFDAAIIADLLEYQALDRRRQRNRADVFTDLDGQRWKQLKEQLSFENSDDRSPLAVFNGKRNDQWPPKTFQRDTSTDCHKLKSITLEITDEPVTNGVVEGVLGWIHNIWPNHLDGERFESINSATRLANSLASGDFTTEVKK